MAFLDLTHIRKSFGTSTAVYDFSLPIEKGEFVSFLGPSGCGKTTVLRMIAGLEYPTAGGIQLDGKDITHLNANKRNIGMVFQQYALFPNLNVFDNICFGLKVGGMARSEMRTRADEMLRLIHMQDFANRYPHQLSGGQQQRVALARALAMRPQVLLLDEPLSALDAKIRTDLRQEIRAIQRKLGITTIFVTHDQEEALSIADRIVVMNKGLIEQVGTPQEIYNHPQTEFVASFIGTLNVLEAQVTNANLHQIQLDGQPIATDEPLETDQQNVLLALRPESIVMNGNGDHAAQANHLTATVDDIYFLGSVVRIRTRLDKQHLNVDTFNDPGLLLPAAGEQVKLSFSASAVKILKSREAAVASNA